MQYSMLFLQRKLITRIYSILIIFYTLEFTVQKVVTQEYFSNAISIILLKALIRKIRAILGRQHQGIVGSAQRRSHIKHGGVAWADKRRKDYKAEDNCGTFATARN